MTRPVNLYAITRIHEEEAFNIVEKHQSQTEDRSRIQYHEIESLRILADELTAEGATLEELDGFFLSFHIPQIGKEFDLLKLTERSCLNIELKSQEVPEEQILNQLVKNRHYLSHLGVRLNLFTFVSKSRTCYRLSLAGELRKAAPGELLAAVRRHAEGYSPSIDEFFRASQYLVSPLETPERFIQGEYFLTQAQEQVKKAVLKGVDETAGGAFFHITGQPGTGKTLLVYDIARALARSGKTAILHCGPLSPEQELVSRSVENLRIVSAAELDREEFPLERFTFLLMDESHRAELSQFRRLCVSARENDQVCVFSSDPEQVLSTAEKERGITGKIRALPRCGEFVLSEKLRCNKELQTFILCLKNLARRPRGFSRYPNVELNYAGTGAEAQNLLAYYRRKGYVFINCARTAGGFAPYAEFEEDFDACHVIGREFDRVVMLMDSAFYYDEEGVLRGVPSPDPDALYPNLFYQSVTRVREKLALIVVNAPELFGRISSILGPEPAEEEPPAPS